MTVREYRSADCVQLAELFCSTVHTVNAADYTQAQLDAWAPGKTDLEKWDRSFREHCTLVAIEHDIIIGFGDLDVEAGYLDRLYVHKDYQRRGAAAALCDRLEAMAPGNIITHASITAKPFFERRGYRTVKCQQVERRGVYLTNYVMEKSGRICYSMNHIQNVQAALEAEGPDAVLLTGEANRFYASGFFTPGADAAALVTKRDAVFLTDARYTEAAGRKLEGIELREVKPGKTLTAQLQELVFLKGIRRLGFEDAAMTVQSYRRLEKALSQSEYKFPCELVPMSEALGKLRQTKDKSELAAMEAAQGIAERALEDILKEIRPGVTEKEVAARLQYLMLHYGASDMSFDPIVVSGPNGSLPHGVPSEKEIQSGEFVTMDFGCIFGGYCSDMTRTVAVGSVTEEMERVYRTVLAAQEAGIAAAKAGVTGKEVDAAARAVIEEAGYGEYFTHSFGHGVGVEIHEAPNASSSSEAPLPAGAVISAEPGVYIPGTLGVRIEDVILITEEGCRNLTKAPKDLIVL